MKMTPSILWESLTLVACVLVFDAWERRRPARRIDRRRAFPLDLLALGVVIVAGTAWKPLLVSAGRAGGMDAWFASVAAPLRRLGGPAKISLGLLLADFCLYWVHRAMHASSVLWRTHVFHHSITDLYWLSGARTSVTHLLLFAVPQVLISTFLLDLSPVQASVAFSIGVVVNLWVHTNLRVRLGPLEPFLITPEFHRVHHGRDLGMSKNFGFILTFWDRAFGTYLDPRTLRDDYPLGLASDEKPARMILGV